MGVFYRDLKESTSFRSILEVMSRSLEYQGMKDSVAGPLPQYWQKYEKEVMGNCEKSQLLDYISFKKVYLYIVNNFSSSFQEYKSERRFSKNNSFTMWVFATN